MGREVILAVMWFAYRSGIICYVGWYLECQGKWWRWRRFKYNWKEWHSKDNWNTVVLTNTIFSNRINWRPSGRRDCHQVKTIISPWRSKLGINKHDYSHEMLHLSWNGIMLVWSYWTFLQQASCLCSTPNRMLAMLLTMVVLGCIEALWGNSPNYAIN